VFEAIDESGGPGAIKNGLYTMLPDGSGLREHYSVTGGGYTTFNMAWSPDRKRIALVKPTDGSVHVLDPSSGDARQIAAPTSLLFRPTLRWHPDNRRVALLSCGGACGIRLVDVATGQSEDTGWNYGSLDWSRDGGFIAFVLRDLSNVDQVNVMRPDGSGRRTLTDGAESTFHTRWSPDGSTLLFRTRQSLWAVPVQGAVARMIAPASGIIPDYFWTPGAWSPDGRHVAYTRLGQLAIARADGTDERIVPTPGWVAWLDW
jgi:Tol biopolymer transport system component